MLLEDSRTWLAQVYDNLVFDDLEFTHMATLPGMWDRTLTLSSIGKTFSVTGWKVISVGPERSRAAICGLRAP